MTENINITWPPPFQVKKHVQARSIKLKIIHGKGLQIITPHYVRKSEIDFALETNKNWILQKLSELCPPVIDLPQEIVFLAMNEKWKTHYVSCNGTFEMFERPGLEIVLSGKIGDKLFCRKKLTNWVKDKAKKFLVTQLKIIGETDQFIFNKVIIRDQQSCWGSCNIKKTISLNYKLIFLPLRLCKYVLFHELCHTRYLNHSNQFWQLLSQFDADFQQHKNELRQAQKYLPYWLF